MFVDEINLILSGGHGGPGKVSFLPGQKSGPDGGNGGKGGDLYIKVTTDLTVLQNYTRQKLITASNGQEGSRQQKAGKNGDDKEVALPVGSLITNLDTGQILELTQPDERILFAKGGLGGRGNAEFKSSRNTTPMYAQPGLPGESKPISISLQLIADFGLIGLPNSGKSSLLNELTNARARVADYPFTTLEPNLGVVNGRIIADIPGLIEGASEGKGLGHKFLKHIEKVTTLLHCLSAESEDPLHDYQTVRQELKRYNPELLTKQEVILITKSDLISDSKLTEIKEKFQKLNPHLLPISIHNYDQIQSLIKQLQIT